MIYTLKDITKTLCQNNWGRMVVPTWDRDAEFFFSEYVFLGDGKDHFYIYLQKIKCPPKTSKHYLDELKQLFPNADNIKFVIVGKIKPQSTEGVIGNVFV